MMYTTHIEESQRQLRNKVCVCGGTAFYVTETLHEIRAKDAYRAYCADWRCGQEWYYDGFDIGWFQVSESQALSPERKAEVIGQPDCNIIRHGVYIELISVLDLMVKQ